MNVVGTFYFMILSEMRKGIRDVIRSEKCKKYMEEDLTQLPH